MTSGRREQIKELFDQALALKPQQRDSFLAETCGDDADLKSELQTLLAHDHGAPAEFMRPPEPETAEAPALPKEGADPLVGQHIGQYHLKRVIDSGGMGTVYLAVQDHPHRTVALKVLRAGLASRSALRRFEFESQILGRLRHPGIAQVYEAGTHDDPGTPGAAVPYFAMEYIPSARTITEYARTKELGTRERLALFVRVCEAVHHGHQKGIIHRDLKPGNILVDSNGQPKIIDFGVARATDWDMTVTTLQTDVGQLIGTLQYMSPEQCDGDPGDLDTRSDVYALGVVLYELLCGQLPYDVTRVAFPEAARVIREVRPPRPSTVNRTLRGDVETVTLKALEKDRERRYRSAADLGDDIRRYLDSEPIEARPPSVTYQIRMFARRNRAAFVAMAAVFAVLVVATVVSLAFAVRANLASQAALAESQQRRAAEQQALASSQEARTQAAIAEAVNDFLTEDLLAAVDPKRTPDREITMRAVLDAASERIQGRFEDQPLVEASIRATLGNTYEALGLYEASERHLTEALELRRTHLGEEDPDTLASMNNLAGLYDKLGRHEDAEQLYLEVLELKRRVLGEEHPNTAISMDGLGVVYRNLGRFDEAEAHFARALELCRRLLGEEHSETLSSLNNLGSLYVELGRYDDAEPLLVQVLESHRRMFGEEHPGTLTSMHNVAFLYRGQERYDEAEPLLKKALEIGRRVQGEEHPDTLGTMGNLTELFQLMGRLDEAERLYRTTLEVMERALPEDNLTRLVYTSNFAELCQTRGRYDEAEAWAARAVAGARRGLPEGHWIAGVFLTVHGQALTALHRYGEAEPALLEAHDILSPAMGATSEYTIAAVGALADLYDAWSKPRKAAEYRALLHEADQGGGAR